MPRCFSPQEVEYFSITSSLPRWTCSPHRPVMKILYLLSNGKTAFSLAPNAVEIRVNEEMLRAAKREFQARELFPHCSPHGPRMTNVDKADFVVKQAVKKIKKS